MNILVTGGAGFIGSHYINYVLNKRPSDLIVNIDSLTYAGNPKNFRPFANNQRHIFFKQDIRDRAWLEQRLIEYNIEAIVNFAAESHVDRSLEMSDAFLLANTQGTLRLLEAARSCNIKRFLQVSTDEVYGSLGPMGAFTESSQITPRSPYSASKAAADHFVMAFHHTHGLNTVITRCCNNFGPRQFPEKLIPLTILSAINNKPIPVYGNGQQVRDWIYVEDHCDAIDFLLLNGISGGIYNVGANCELANLDVVKLILTAVGKNESLIKYVSDRPGHDQRYSIDASLLKSLGWQSKFSFAKALTETIAWYQSVETDYFNVDVKELYIPGFRYVPAR